MIIIDREFYALCEEIKSLDEKEMYYRMRKAFDKVPEVTRKSCENFFNKFGFWGKLDSEKGIFEEIELKQIALKNHIDDFVRLYEKLCDFRSKKTLFSILSNWYRYDFKSTSRTKENLFDDYFDHDILKCSSDEVIADLGAYTGDSVISYIKNYGEDCYKKIYCYEITPSTFEKLKQNLAGYKNIIFRNCGIGDRQETLCLANRNNDVSSNTLSANGENSVKVTTLDEDINEPLTLIKADIEGYELKAIHGAKNHIANEKPRLLISVYHNNDHLWQIPETINSYNDSYKFYLRYNSSPIYPTEITLFAV